MADPTSQEIHMPNGDVLEFPSTMADDAIRAAITAHYGESGWGGPSSFAGGMISGVPVVGPAIQGGAQRAAAGIRSLEYGTPYANELKAVQSWANEQQAKHPLATGTGEVTGGVLAGAAAMGAPYAPALLGGVGMEGLGGAVAASTVGNTALGTADAYMRGQPLTTGAVTGAIGGATTPLVGRGAGAVVGSLSDALAGRISQPELAGLSPLAMKFLVSAAKADGLTDAEIANKYALVGPQGFLAEYGANLQGLAGSFKALPGTGKNAIITGLDDRAAAARQSIENSVTAAFGPRVNIAQLTAQREVDRALAADPLYETWRNTNVPMTPELAAIVRLPSVKDAFPAAAKMAANEGQPLLNAQTGGPTAQTWDYVKRALDDQARAAGFGTNQARIATGISNRIKDAIDNHPDPNVAGVWQAARQAYAVPSAIQDAQTAGQSVFSRAARVDDLQAQFNGYSDPEKQAFLQGARDNVTQMIDASARGDTNARNMFLAPANQDKLRLIVGPQKADQLVQDMQQFATQAANRSQIGYNSETAARQNMTAMVTPDPSQTLIARARAGYSPHVTPLALVPRAFENMAAGRQAAQFEQARNQAAPILMTQGTDAQRLARALYNYQPGGGFPDAATQAAIAATSQGVIPKTRALAAALAAQGQTQ
jgi:hypothetical protein